MKQTAFLKGGIYKETDKILALPLTIREHLTGKKEFSFGHCPIYLNPPSPQNVKHDVLAHISKVLWMISSSQCFHISTETIVRWKKKVENNF